MCAADHLLRYILVLVKQFPLQRALERTWKELDVEVEIIDNTIAFISNYIRWNRSPLLSTDHDLIVALWLVVEKLAAKSKSRLSAVNN